jgi:hypothetical protein
LEDSVLRLVGLDGQAALVENDDVNFPDRSSLIEWTAETTGVYYLQVTGFDGFIGTYVLIAEVDPLLGDLNEDQQLDAHDIDLMFAAIRANKEESRYDVDGDGQVGVADADTLIRDIIGSMPGDADLDGQVQFRDFLWLARNFNSESGWGGGDFDGSGFVDFKDFLLLASNFGKSVAIGEASVRNSARSIDSALLAFHTSAR